MVVSVVHPRPQNRHFHRGLHHAQTTAIVVLGGQGAHLCSCNKRAIVATILTDDKPVKALVGAASHHDLIVTGKRGLHGLATARNGVVASTPSSVVVREPHHIA